MPQVDIRWRPSGGRGEYEHVPSDVLMGRRVVVRPVSVRDCLISTDVTGHLRDGKPRLRREHPDDRSLLNLVPLIAALALFPDPMREDKGVLPLPLRNKGYVVSSVTCEVEYADNGDAICTPLRMQILHDASVIDLFGRLTAVEELLGREDLSPKAAAAAELYRAIAGAGQPLADLRGAANDLREWLDVTPSADDLLNVPSPEVAPEPAEVDAEVVTHEEMTADETKRRLVSHFRIERNRSISRKKVAHFKEIHGRVFCEVCEFAFEDRYGEYAKDVIDVHHTRQLATLMPNTMTKLSDLILLCSNCHRVAHRRKTPLTPDELRSLLVPPSAE